MREQERTVGVLEVVVDRTTKHYGIPVMISVMEVKFLS
jgi:hypothetical protein